MLFRKKPADAQRLQQLIQLYGPLVLAVTRRILGAGPDAEEAAQETFLAVFDHLSKIPENDSPKTRRYLVIIAENKAIDLWRARVAHPQLPLEEAILWVD